jgi:hypothetical protein
MRASLLVAASLAATTLAAPGVPLEARDVLPETEFLPTTEDAAAALLAPWWPFPWRRSVEAITTYGYDIGTGTIECHPNNIFSLLSVSKAPQNGGHDQTALFTFRYPPWTAGKQCRIVFDLDTLTSVQGSGQLDLFSSNAPAPGCRPGWGFGNQRNEHLGRLQAKTNAPVTYIAKYGGLTNPGPCPAPGTLEAYELVGVGDNDNVTWRPARAGLKILVSN